MKKYALYNILYTIFAAQTLCFPDGSAPRTLDRTCGYPWDITNPPQAVSLNSPQPSHNTSRDLHPRANSLPHNPSCATSFPP